MDVRVIKKAEPQRIDAFELWCWRRLLRVPWTARRSNQSILKEVSPGCSLQGLMLNWSPNTLATWCEELTHWKRPLCWERLKAGGKGKENEMVGWHHWLNGHEFEQAQGVCAGQGSLACWSPWGRKELDMTEWLNWLMQNKFFKDTDAITNIWLIITWKISYMLRPSFWVFKYG